MASTPPTSGLAVAPELGETAPKSSCSGGGTSEMASTSPTSVLPVAPDLEMGACMPSFSATKEMAATSPTRDLAVAPDMGEIAAASSSASGTSEKTSSAPASFLPVAQDMKELTTMPSSSAGSTSDLQSNNTTSVLQVAPDLGKIATSENTSQIEDEVKVLAPENKTQEPTVILDLRTVDLSSTASSTVISLTPQGSPHPPTSDFTFEAPNAQSSTQAVLTPIYATHYPPTQHFQICPDIVDLTSPYWLLGMSTPPF